MSSTKRRIQVHKNAEEEIKRIWNKEEIVLIIHYSCEGFYEKPDGQTSRIASIVVKHLDSGQTKSFSIHSAAEIKGKSVDEIEKNFDELEKDFLDDFFEYLKDHKNHYWVHWNMRNAKYGFEAINQRYRILGGIPVAIDDKYKKDLSRIFDDLYGDDYIEPPKLQTLAEKNGFNTKDLLSGEDEAQAFQNKEYVKLHQSTLRKVELLEKYLKHSDGKNLKINSGMIKIYGVTPQGIFELIKNYWIFYLLFNIISFFIGAFASHVILKFL